MRQHAHLTFIMIRATDTQGDMEWNHNEILVQTQDEHLPLQHMLTYERNSILALFCRQEALVLQGVCAA